MNNFNSVYINLFYVFIVLAVVLFVLAIVLFFALDIPNAFRIVNKKPPKKGSKNVSRSSATGDLNRISGEKKPKQKAEKLSTTKPFSNNETTVLKDNFTPEKKSTTVLNSNISENPANAAVTRSKTTVLKGENISEKKMTGDMNKKIAGHKKFETIETDIFAATDYFIDTGDNENE